MSHHRIVAKGFTLIELLVVIGIIALLSSVVFASLVTARTKARDARRVADMRQIYTALHLYVDAYGCLPTTGSGEPTPTTTCGPALGTFYKNAGGWDYSSQYWNGSGWTYSKTQGDFLGFLSTGTNPIMKKVPVDPINNMQGDDTGPEYAYRYYCDSVDGLELTYWREYPTRERISFTESSTGTYDPSFICQ